MKNLKDIRNEYMLMQLDEKDVHPDPVHLFNQWLQAAMDAGVKEPTAMNLATADNTGKPSSRIVLLKDVTENGFTFFTNYNSKKGKHLAENPHACLRIEGKVEKIASADSDAYFNSRPPGSRIGAISSPQSQVIPNRAYIEQKVDENTRKFSDQATERPDYWGGYHVMPETIEFWQGRESRLHDRILYTLKNGEWKIQRLAP
ncbi:MAG: pyridoxamine 5'-phosphate oxidase [Bacteroidetes bacterium]|jgi:pyridoxamine 5'-phosphate oxidase|nr:pyridoxamine 5'-phosphate oxidase [Bacteroidota bacterium]